MWRLTLSASRIVAYCAQSSIFTSAKNYEFARWPKLVLPDYKQWMKRWLTAIWSFLTWLTRFTGLLLARYKNENLVRKIIECDYSKYWRGLVYFLRISHIEKHVRHSWNFVTNRSDLFVTNYFNIDRWAGVQFWSPEAFQFWSLQNPSFELRPTHSSCVVDSRGDKC